MLETTRSLMIRACSFPSFFSHPSRRSILDNDDDHHYHPAQSPTTPSTHRSYLRPCSV